MGTGARVATTLDHMTDDTTPQTPDEPRPAAEPEPRAESRGGSRARAPTPSSAASPAASAATSASTRSCSGSASSCSRSSARSASSPTSPLLAFVPSDGEQRPAARSKAVAVGRRGRAGLRARHVSRSSCLLLRPRSARRRPRRAGRLPALARARRTAPTATRPGPSAGSPSPRSSASPSPGPLSASDLRRPWAAAWSSPSLAVVAGLALVGTAFVGGARWLIVPALALVLPLGVVSAADIDLDGGVGDREYRPATMTPAARPLRPRHRLADGRPARHRPAAAGAPTSTSTSASARRSCTCRATPA